MITIVVPISRSDYLARFFIRLEMLDCDSEKTNLLCYVDGPLELFQKVRNYTVNSKFKNKLCVYRKKGIASVSSVHRRRQRISDIHNEIKELINDCDYIFLTEDDTLFPMDTLKKLYKTALNKKYFGFISGVELGRWGYEHIGAWKLDNVYDPNQITSIKLGKGIEEIDAAGLYCCLTTKENYMKNFFKPFENILGPDFDFGINLRKQGLLNFIDHSIHCEHLNLKGSVTVLNSKIIQIRFDKNDNEKFGWTQSVLGKDADI